MPDLYHLERQINNLFYDIFIKLENTYYEESDSFRDDAEEFKAEARQIFSDYGISWRDMNDAEYRKDVMDRHALTPDIGKVIIACHRIADIAKGDGPLLLRAAKVTLFALTGVDVDKIKDSFSRSDRLDREDERDSDRRDYRDSLTKDDLKNEDSVYKKREDFLKKADIETKVDIMLTKAHDILGENEFKDFYDNVNEVLNGRADRVDVKEIEKYTEDKYERDASTNDHSEPDEGHDNQNKVIDENKQLEHKETEPLDNHESSDNKQNPQQEQSSINDDKENKGNAAVAAESDDVNAVNAKEEPEVIEESSNDEDVSFSEESLNDTAEDEIEDNATVTELQQEDPDIDEPIEASHEQEHTEVVTGEDGHDYKENEETKDLTNNETKNDTDTTKDTPEEDNDKINSEEISSNEFAEDYKESLKDMPFRIEIPDANLIIDYDPNSEEPIAVINSETGDGYVVPEIEGFKEGALEVVDKILDEQPDNLEKIMKDDVDNTGQENIETNVNNGDTSENIENNTKDNDFGETPTVPEYQEDNVEQKIPETPVEITKEDSLDNKTEFETNYSDRENQSDNPGIMNDNYRDLDKTEDMLKDVSGEVEKGDTGSPSLDDYKDFESVE